MSISEPISRVRFYGWMLLVLLAAVWLRLYQILSVPPGLTHDEADHGITAWSILSEGVREIYFTIGYGREPFYDYATALLMTFLGPTFLAGRITAVYFSLILIAGMAAWVRQAFDGKAALLTAAGLAVGFWPVMAGRQSLRSIVLPALFVLVVAVFWLGLKSAAAGDVTKINKNWRSLLLFLSAGVLLGLTFYAYIPARALWIVFPALLGYFFATRRSLFKKIWPQTSLMLLVMVLVALPLLVFLNNNPGAEVRIEQLAAPVNAALQGEIGPLLENIIGSLRLFFIEGDFTWRYNIAARPLLGPLMGFLFVAGVLLALWYSYRRREDLHYGAASFLALSWLLAGFLPVLVTGPELSMTQAIGIQPVLYLFPALSLLAIGQTALGDQKIEDRRWVSVGVFFLFLAVAVFTYRDYFLVWANTPEVRVQYETTMATAMEYLNEHGEAGVAVSSISPDRYHSPALGKMLLRNDAFEPRWFDARTSILLPPTEKGQLILPGFTPLSPLLKDYLSTAVLVESLPLRETDLDRPLDIYSVNQADMSADWGSRLSAEDVDFGDALVLQGYQLQTPEVAPGEEVQIVTLWGAKRALEEAMIFVHMVAAEDEPLAQADQLGVPSYAWQPGDRFLQTHTFVIPEDTPAGTYPLKIGVYTQRDGLRLPVTGSTQAGDMFTFANLAVTP